MLCTALHGTARHRMYACTPLGFLFGGAISTTPLSEQGSGKDRLVLWPLVAINIVLNVVLAVFRTVTAVITMVIVITFVMIIEQVSECGGDNDR